MEGPAGVPKGTSGRDQGALKRSLRSPPPLSACGYAAAGSSPVGGLPRVSAAALA